MSILDDIEDQIDNTDEVIKNNITRWIEDNVKSIEENKLKFDFNTSPITVDYDGNIEFKDNIIELTDRIFQWGEVNKIFCCHCGELDLKKVPKVLENKLITECSDCNVSTFYHFENTLHTEISDKYNKCTDPKFVEKVQEIHKNKVLPSLLNIKGEILSWKSVPLSIGCIPIHFDINRNRNEYENINDAENYLGLYCRTYKDNKREIILFEDAIMAEAKGDKEYLENLIRKVIIHEYAHAIMDTLQDNKLKSQDSKLYKYREESLANVFALKVLEMSIENTLITKSGFDKIKGFVDKQDEEYRHGLDLYNDLYESKDLLKMMEFWREMKIEGNKRF